MTGGGCWRSKTAPASTSSAATVVTIPPAFPTFAGAIAQLSARTLALDGEVCAFDAQLISHIYLLDVAPEQPETPPVFMAFDCMQVRGRDLRSKPLAYRRGDRL